jgi:ABC-type multidrug transport system fused ATPase/permease subunit
MLKSIENLFHFHFFTAEGEFLCHHHHHHRQLKYYDKLVMLAQGSCFCPNRWVPPAPVALEVGNVGLVGRSRHSSEDSASVLGRPVTIAVDLAWQNLAISVTDPDTHTVKQILYPSSGVILPGEMCALVGPSGAGAMATTFVCSFIIVCCAFLNTG